MDTDDPRDYAGLNRLSASVRIWTPSTSARTTSRRLRLNRLSASVRIWTPQVMEGASNQDGGLNRLSASVRIWTIPLYRYDARLQGKVLIAFRLQSEFGPMMRDYKENSASMS